MSKHTPGPWRIENDASPYIYAPDNTPLAIIISGEANEYLISASPDLLEACEAHMAALASKIRDGKDRPEYAEAIYQAQKKMDAAIKKARGES